MSEHADDMTGVRPADGGSGDAAGFRWSLAGNAAMATGILAANALAFGYVADGSFAAWAAGILGGALMLALFVLIAPQHVMRKPAKGQARYHGFETPLVIVPLILGNECHALPGLEVASAWLVIVGLLAVAGGLSGRLIALWSGWARLNIDDPLSRGMIAGLLSVVPTVFLGGWLFFTLFRAG